MRLHVLNLPDQTSRWAMVSQQFRTLGLPVQRARAVDGRLLPEQLRASLYDPALNRAQYHRPLVPGEIGCYASHIALWRDLVASGERAVAVFEDDVTVSAELPQILAALERLSMPWDLVKLVGRRREKVLTRLPFTRHADLIRYRRVPGLTAGYVIHRRGARKLLAQRPPFGRPIDVDLRHWWECDLNIVGVHPYPVQLGPASTVTTIPDRQVPLHAAGRVRKLAMQARYSFRNWQALHALPADRVALVPFALPLTPAGGDDT